MSRSPSPTLFFEDDETFPQAEDAMWDQMYESSEKKKKDLEHELQGLKEEYKRLKQKISKLIKRKRRVKSRTAELDKEIAELAQARPAKAEANKKIEAISTRTSRYLGQPSLF